MARLLTRAQRLQNRAFLKALARSGNVRLACRELGLKYGTMQHRRRHHPAFAVQWDAALAFAQATLQRGGLKAPKAKPGAASPNRTGGGELVVVRRNDGRLQVRRAQPGKLTREAEQAFLAALSATANVTLSAAAAGASPAAFYRRMKRSRAFARERRLALQMGYERLELALLESQQPGAFEHDEWSHNEPPAIPPMTANQALQLMYLHQKEARLIDEPWPIKRRRGESRDAQSVRLGAMWAEQERRIREEFELAEAARWARGEDPWGPAGEAVRREIGDRCGFALPDLAQVTGWSRADPAKEAHDPGRALFGGWRIADMREELERREWEQAQPERACGGCRTSDARP